MAAWILAFVVGRASLAAQDADTGVVAGSVTEAGSERPVAGAVVTLRGTTLAVQTDGGGRFSIPEVSPGVYTVGVSKAGFVRGVLTDVRVAAGQTTRADARLQAEYYELEPFEAITEPYEEQSVEILADRQKAASMTDAIGSVQFQRLGVGNAAEIMTKITGVTVSDGKFAVIRGLADRYNVTTLNGAEVPSADPYRRAAQLDLIPSAMIETMVVAKTFTPDLQGGFAGGAVNIVTKTFPPGPFAKFTVGSGWNTLASGNDRFLSYEGGGLDWAGMDDGLRELPVAALQPLDLNAAQRQFRNADERAQRQALAEAYDAALRSFGNNTFAPSRGAPGPNYNFSVSGGDRGQIWKLPVGYFASVNYDQKYAFVDQGFRGRYNDEATGLQPVSEFTVDRGIDEVSWGAVGSVGVQLAKGHEINLNFIRNQSAQDVASVQDGRVVNLNQFQPGETSFSRLYLLGFTERFLQNFQARGTHTLEGVNDLKVDWISSFANTGQEDPDVHIFPLQVFPQADGTSFVVAQNPDLPNVNSPTRFFRNSEESNRNFRLDLTLPIDVGNGLESSLKGGLFYSRSERELREYRFSYNVPNPQVPWDPDTFANTVLNPVGPTYVETVNASGRGRFDFRQGPVFDGNPVGPYGYDGSQEITAAYFMGDVSVWDRLRLIGGLRLETTDLQTTPLPLGQEPGVSLRDGVIQAEDLLPSAAMVWTLRTNMNLRLSYAGTLARPTYREYAQFGALDLLSDEFVRGNPSLQRTLIDNYDLRWEWFRRPGEVLSASFFYKDLSNPIEKLIVDAQNGVVSFTNRPSATVFGFELEARTSLDVIDEMLADFSVGMNFTWIESEVSVARPGFEYSRPLFDQPQYIANADITYDNASWGTTATLVFNQTGERLVAEVGNAPNVYEQPYPTLDFILGQKFLKRWQARLSVKNLLDPTVKTIFVRDYGGSRDDFDGRFVYRSFSRGTTISLSLSAEF